ncbi:MAG: sigma-70 family RNA polymerase sigma factor [Anaerolineae bacterium]|nr:sigma-70 family RNA polymerase sigma factor [Anaerolineae bacterium]
MSSVPEGDLARRAASGDQEAFAEIVRLHQQAVFNVAYRYFGNVKDAEDAAQDAFVRAYQFFDRFDVNRPLAPWLKRITVNVCLNIINADKPTASLDDDLPPPKDPKPGPEAQTATRQRERRMRAEIVGLPPRYRAVIELRHFQELSYTEIASALKRSQSDIKSDLFRARKLLAERLIDLKYETSD